MNQQRGGCFEVLYMQCMGFSHLELELSGYNKEEEAGCLTLAVTTTHRFYCTITIISALKATILYLRFSQQGCSSHG